MVDLPCTSWARTIVDLAELLSVHDLTRVIERSAVQRCYDGRALAAAIFALAFAAAPALAAVPTDAKAKTN